MAITRWFRRERPQEEHAARQSEHVDPDALMRIKSLQLRARAVVEGYLSGLHRSPYHGFSVEFTEYRQYTPGDDLRYLDWRLYARSDRFYLKRFEDETNLRCHLLLDLSRSMSYGSRGYSKSDYARTLAATFSYFLAMQRDAVGVMTFDEQLGEYLPPRYRPGHLHRIMLCLEREEGGRGTNLIEPLDQLAQVIRKRGLIVLISDLLAPAEQLDRYLGYLAARGHDVVIFRVLDPAELEFSFEQPTMFRDLENGGEMYIDPQAARAEYHRRFQQHATSLDETCGRLGIELRTIRTDEPLELAMFQFVEARARRGRLARTRRMAGGAR